MFPRWRDPAGRVADAKDDFDNQAPGRRGGATAMTMMTTSVTGVGGASGRGRGEEGYSGRMTIKSQRAKNCLGRYVSNVNAAPPTYPIEGKI